MQETELITKYQLSSHHALALLALLVASTGARAQTYSISEIDTLGGADHQALGVNSSGVVVGYSNTTTGIYHGFVTGTDGVGITALDASSASGINDSGQITGVTLVPAASISGFTYNAYITGPYGVGVTPLGALPTTAVGAALSDGTAINANGQVTGFSNTNTGGQHAFVSGPNGVGLTDVGALAAGANSAGYAINIHGQVAGGSSGVGFTSHAVITGPNGAGMTDLGTLGGAYSSASGINDLGQVTGIAATAGSEFHAFITGANGAGMIDLGTLGGPASSGAGINNKGEVVGQFWLTGLTGAPGETLTHGFLYAGGRMVDLNTLIDPSSPLAMYVTITDGVSITDNGYILALGTDSRVTGTQSFLLKASASPVPLPAASWLLSGGLLTLVGAFRRRRVDQAHDCSTRSQSP